MQLDIQNLVEKKLISKLTSFSFTILLLDRLSKLPKTRNFILKALGGVYDSINFELFEEIDLEELSTELPKMVPNLSFLKKDTVEFFNEESTSRQTQPDIFDESLRRSSSNLNSILNSRRSKYSLSPEENEKMFFRSKSHGRLNTFMRFNKIKHRNNSKQREKYFKLFVDNVKHSPAHLRRSKSRHYEPTKLFDY